MRYLFIHRFYVVWLILSLFYSTGLAQQQNSDLGGTYAKLYESFRKTYSFDQELVNGIFYENPYWKALGHPFLLENQFYTGTLVYHGKRYDHVEMKYDIYEQKMLINYQFNDKQLNILLLNEFISEFSFNGKMFGFFSFSEMKPAFFQVIAGGNDLKCLYH
ncbi:MAG: hypothetical protein A2Y71_12340 [Bacteroidetes bacterium RBG_13_42_15]|nr:MAG: hypothetical protein A2Y71_12340 [Bacteroidetes bacterium RBG_13_42_15]